MLGVLLLRGEIIPLIDLKEHLQQRDPGVNSGTRPVVLVCEFNHRTNGFLVDGVNQIHRISWSDVKPLAQFINQYRPKFTGSISIDGREILILDLEYIIGEFDPDSVLGQSSQDGVEGDASVPSSKRQQMKILMAEDSSVIRHNLQKVLRASGYTNLEVFTDGEACYQRILQLKQQSEAVGEDLGQQMNMLISDIEMPKMDGLTLCRKIKEELGYKQIPVLLFSSLINPPMEVKCDSVGADGYASKPEVAKLLEMMDHFLGIAS